MAAMLPRPHGAPVPTDIRAALVRWRRDRMAFRREAIVLENGQALGSVMEPWQGEDFAALDHPETRHAYLERCPFRLTHPDGWKPAAVRQPH